MRLVSLFIVGITALGMVHAHANHDFESEILERRNFLTNSKRTDLRHCSDKLNARGSEKRAVQRRKATAALNSKHGILPRAAADINRTHHSNQCFNADTSLDTVFATNVSCLLSPSITEGPYYVEGEYIRKNITEGQPGVPLIVDIDILDTETCEPLSDFWVDIWHCNSTGIYSAQWLGNNYTYSPELLQTSWLRGFQKTDQNGAVQFDTIFPGHYLGRTQHIHVIVHPSAQPRPNGTIDDREAIQIGQIYFDQALIDEVESVWPYNTNDQPFTTNDEDLLLAAGLESMDPIMNYALLGETVSEGVLAWISFGVNTTYHATVNAAATLQEGGSVENNNTASRVGTTPFTTYYRGY